MAFTDTDGIALLNWTAPASAGALPTPGTNVAFNANGNTLLYTVPTGYRCILSHAKVEAGANANSTDLTIGGNASTYNDFVPTTQCDNLDAQYDVIELKPVNSTTPPKEKSYASGTSIYMTVANQAGGSTNRVYLYGMLTPV